MCKEMTFWLEQEWKNHSELLSDYIKERLEFGSEISSDQLLLDNVVIEHCRAYINSLFDDFDYIITPSAPGPAHHEQTNRLYPMNLQHNLIQLVKVYQKKA